MVVASALPTLDRVYRIPHSSNVTQARPSDLLSLPQETQLPNRIPLTPNHTF